MPRPFKIEATVKQGIQMYKKNTHGIGTPMRLYHKIWLIMRLTTIIILLTLIQVSAATKAQNVTLKKTNASLKSIFTELKKQTGYIVLYPSSLINSAKPVTISLTNTPLKDAMGRILENQNLEFEIQDNSIIVRQKALPFLGNSNAIIAAIDISGRVLDDKGQAVTGVTIREKGKDNTVVSGTGGNFKIMVADQDAVLIFSFVGYKQHEIKVGSKKTIDVILSTITDVLQEVVISGYTVQNRTEFTGSSAHISGKDIENRPVVSFDQALAGQAAGVKITSNGGSLNAPPTFRIRGTNSINLSSYPLIIIDGITSFNGNGGSLNGVENNPLSSVNTNDIESIEVLKDASATAIYGSRAANGVVVITTKKGRAGKAKFSYDAYFGTSKIPKLPELLGAEEYVAIKREAQTNSGVATTFNVGKNADGSTQETNWYDYFYQTGNLQNHNLSISGASEATSYFVSLSYADQTGFLVKNTFNRKSARVNIDHRLIKSLHVGTNFTYSDVLNNNLSSVYNTFGRNNLARLSMVLPPNILAYNADGSYNISGNSIALGPNTVSVNYFHPLPTLDNDKYTSASKNFLGLVYAELELLKGLKLKTNYSINSLNVANTNFNNPIQGNGFGSNGSASSDHNENYRTDFTNTINYTGTISNHHVNALVGYQEIYTETNGTSASRSGLIDPFFQSFAGGFTTSSSNGNFSQNGFRSYFANVFYDYQKKYLLSASFRRDGFSGLAANHKYGNFSGGSIGWNVSEEGFFKNSTLAKTVSALKVRASYGQVGNVTIGDYAAASLYGAGTYGGVPTLALSQTGNPDLKWETSKKTDIGINIGLWKNRVTLDADYYNNNIDGLILAAPQTPSKGIPSNTINANIGSMYNRGFEFDVKAHIIYEGAFRWTSGFNISTLKNRVTALANNNADLWTASLETSNITRVGYSVGSVYVVNTTGVNPANGFRTYVNRNGATVQYNPKAAAWSYLDGTTAPAMEGYADGTVMGPTLPTYYGGFNNSFSYKNFDLYVNIVFSGGNKIYNGTKATLLNNNFFNNQTDILRRWTTPGQDTDISAVYFNDQISGGSTLPNSFNVENGAYIKLGTAALSYTIPDRFYKKVGVTTIRLFTSANNLILHTDYTGSDPEVSANGDLASNTGAGRDKNLVPAGKSFTFGINVGF